MAFLEKKMTVDILRYCWYGVVLYSQNYANLQRITLSAFLKLD